MKAQPTMIRGVLYPSQRAAAQALGVHPQTVSQALDRGRPDGVALHKATGKLGRPGTPCRMNGRVWPSITDAARALGVHRDKITEALEDGRDSIRPGRKAA